MSDALCFAFHCMKIQKGHLGPADGEIGIIKCGINQKVIISTNRFVVVKGIVDQKATNVKFINVVQPWLMA